MTIGREPVTRSGASRTRRGRAGPSLRRQEVPPSRHDECPPDRGGRDALALPTGLAACAPPNSGDRRARARPLQQVFADPALAACLAAAPASPTPRGGPRTPPWPRSRSSPATGASTQGPIRSLAGLEQLPR